MKFNARKKLLSLVVASAMSGGVMLAAAPAAAAPAAVLPAPLNIAQDGVGEVLLFPYYTVKNGFDTILTITNTSEKTTAFKIRFREALNSRETIDFNVILSPHDFWNAVVTKDGDGAVVRTRDNSCTSPHKTKWVASTNPADPYFQVAMKNDLMKGSYADGASADLSRVQEGYFEVIQMGVSRNETDAVARNAKHQAATGAPLNCAAVDAAMVDDVTVSAAFDANWIAPENILKGHVTYINVASGQAIDAEPTVIQNWRSLSHVVKIAVDESPTLNDGDPLPSISYIYGGAGNTFGNDPGEVVGTPANGVSMLLMADSVVNEYATGSGAATSWVLTFPTKHYYTDATGLTAGVKGTVTTPRADNAPFAYEFTGDTDGTGKSCDTIAITSVNREEGPYPVAPTPGQTDFSGGTSSPVAPDPETKLCYEVNVLDFNGTSIFGSGVNHLAVDTSKAGTAGWSSVNLNINETAASGSTHGLNTFTGLPVIGFAAILRNTLQGATQNYGSSLSHAYRMGNP